jgi:hypothetical protein
MVFAATTLLFLFIDPLYLLFLAPGMALAAYASYRVKKDFTQFQEVPVASGMTGAQAAQKILDDSGVPGCHVEETQGFLSDHYDPRDKTLRLSPDVYHGRSISALGVAAHEAGHALQDGKGYLPLKIRNGIVPLASVGSNISWILIMIGALIASGGSYFGQSLIMAGIFAFSLTVFFQLVNLPVEFDASKRAKVELVNLGLIHRAEEPQVARVLRSAALTYVAATLTAILTLLYFLVRYAGVGRSEE